jgi:hypothetical protein
MVFRHHSWSVFGVVSHQLNQMCFWFKNTLNSIVKGVVDLKSLVALRLASLLLHT